MKVSNRAGFLYIMLAANGLVKIGIAEDVQKRLISIQRVSPVDVTLLATKETDFVRSFELHLHSKFARQRSHGEWFKLSAETLQALLRDLDNLHFEHRESILKTLSQNSVPTEPFVWKRTK